MNASATIPTRVYRNDLQYTSVVFDHVDWSRRGAYMERKHNITPGSRTMRCRIRIVSSSPPTTTARAAGSVRIIGYSLMADEIIAVIVVEEDGIEYGVNGWVASVKDRRIYRDTKNVSGGSEEASDP